MTIDPKIDIREHFSNSYYMKKETLEHLHAYWRMEYVEAPNNGGSKKDLFSDIPKNPKDKEVHIVFRGKHSYIVLNRYPYNPGHMLVVPYRAVNDLKELTAEERTELMDNVIKSQDILTKALSPQGFNIGINLGEASGAGIPEHIHIHVVPRWKGDTNFMPVIGQTKVLPQSLDSLWERLREFCN